MIHPFVVRISPTLQRHPADWSLDSRRSRLLRHRVCALKRLGAQARRCVQRLLPFDKAQGGELVEPRKRRYGSTELAEVRRY